MKPAIRNTLKVLCLIIGLLGPCKGEAAGRKSASIVVCAETGKIYDAINPDELIPPASLTKMMTLYLTFKALREGRLTLHEKIPVSSHATRQQPSKLGLKQGTCLRVHDAILGLVTKSANDAAVVLAEALGQGSEKHFARHMTRQAQTLGMKNTIFKNASGLPHKEQITTARDMAILSRALYRHFPEYYPFFKTKEFSYCGTVHKNHNHLLGKVKGVDGIKTGFTCASGFNLAASMVRGEHRLIAVVLGGETRHARDRKMAHLLEATHAELTGQPYVPLKEAVWAEPRPLKKKKRLSLGQKKKGKKKRGKRQKRIITATYQSVDHLIGTLNPAKEKGYDSLDHLIGTLK